MRPNFMNALGRYLSAIDWSTIENYQSTEDKLKYFTNIISTGMVLIMPKKSVKLHANDTPWMTEKLKSMLQQRQKSLSQNNITLFKVYRN